jgi:hypothetical protein
MVAWFTTTCAMSAYHHKCRENEPNSWLGVLHTTLCDKVCQWLATGWWFSPDTSVVFFFNVVIMFIPVCLSVCRDNNKYKSCWNFLHASIEGVKVPEFGLVYGV